MSNVPDFDPTKPFTPSTSALKKVTSERLFLNVQRFETPSDSFPYVVGERIDVPGEIVRVRLNTIAERLADYPKAEPAKVEALYVSGATHRDSLLDKKKDAIKLLAFDDARVIGEVDGVTEYRAHWPHTMAVDPTAEVMTGLMHIKLQEADETNPKSTARVEVVKSRDLITKDNALEVLTKALSIKDENGNARDPFIIIRASHEESNFRANPRIYPARETATKFDPNYGTQISFTRTAGPDRTIQELLEGKPGTSNANNDNLSIARVLIAGVLQRDMPSISSDDAAFIEKATRVYAGAFKGAFKMEVLGLEQVDFGLDSGKTYLAKRDQTQLARYRIAMGNEQKNWISDGFTDTVMAFQRHPDGEPYAIYAQPVAMYPVTKPLRNADLSGVPALAPLAALAAEAAAPTPVADVVAATPQAEAPVAQPIPTPTDDDFVINGESVPAEENDDYMP